MKFNLGPEGSFEYPTVEKTSEKEKGCRETFVLSFSKKFKFCTFL